MRVLLVAVLALTGCQAAVPDEMGIEVNPADYLPYDYPPRIGGVAAVLNGQGMVWDTYDYSIGAFDSSVQFTDFNGETRFFLTGEQVGLPNVDENRLRLFALMTGPDQRGALQSPVVEFIEGAWDGPRLSSSGSVAEVVLDSVILDEGGYGGQVKGHFSATLCEGNGDPIVVDQSKCQPISGTFDSRLQISGS
jgi:hypothetical protein